MSAGAGARKRMWQVLALVMMWPAWALARSVVQLPFENDIGNVLAVATAITIVFTLRAVPVPDLRDWRRKRHILELRAELAGLDTRLGVLEARAAAHDVRVSGNTEATRRALLAAGVPVPDALAADAPTQPIYLADRRRAI